MVRALVLLAVILSTACARPAGRAPTATPIAQPTAVAAVVEESLPSPPTLIASIAPTVTVRPSATATPRPEDLPVVRNQQPAADAEVQMGEVQITAEISALGNLAQVIASVNALPVRAEIEVRDARTWRAVVHRTLEPGPYEVRLVALDDQRRMTDHRWRFKVLPPPTATPTQTPTASATPLPTATLTALPTSSPTWTSTPSPTSVELATSTPVVLAPPTPRSTQVTQVQMPLVRGMRADDARSQLQRLGLQVESRVVQSPAPKDIVVEQAPAPGTSLGSGSGVTLSVSAGR